MHVMIMMDERLSSIYGANFFSIMKGWASNVIIMFTLTSDMTRQLHYEPIYS